MNDRHVAGRPGGRALVGVAIALLALALAAPAAAHRTNVSTSKLTVEGAGVDYRLTVSAHDLAVALGIETDLVTPVPRVEFETRAEALTRYFTDRIRIFSDDVPCAQAPARVDYGGLPAEIRLDLAFRCPAPVERLRLIYLVFFDIDPRHRALGVVDSGTGPEEFLIEANMPEFEYDVAAPPPPWIERATRVLMLGIEHILVGIDHILFLIALLIVSARFVDLLKVVTAFTLAHSVTLGLAWYGVIDLPSRIVESAIALSIAYVAAENLTGRRFARRWMLAFGFGLVHGLGFYQMLAELNLQGVGAATTLVSFNLGVEVGQLMIVAVVYPVIALAFDREWYNRAMRGGSTAILAIAGFWFVQRAFIF